MNSSGKQIFRFGDVEVDRSQGCVRRGGQEVHLRQQTFQVMIYLLENRERLVTKEELMQSIWKETSVTDDALVQCVMDIRRAIGDDSRPPQFIKTLPKKGYRFVSPVEEQWTQREPARKIQKEAASVSIPVEIEKSSNNYEPQSAAQPVTSPPAARVRTTRLYLALVGVAVVLVAASFYLVPYLRNRHVAFRTPPTEVSLPQVPGRQTVAVMYFDNQSGSSDLDWLREGLADMIITDLSRSTKLSLLSRQQLHLLLERIGHKENQKIRLDEALDVARRSQAKIVILGSFARLGEQIRIDVQLHDVRDGQMLAAERLVVADPAQILTQVDLLSLKLASHLGAAPPGPEVATGLTSVMTNNLDAYRYYSLALGQIQMFQFPDAIALLEKAIALDSQFAMAYARIGYLYAVKIQPREKAKPYLEKAFQLSDRLSEKDKLHVIAWDAQARSDTSRAVQTYQQLISQYPLETEAYERLAYQLHAHGRNEEALTVINNGLVIDPEAKELSNTLGGVYLRMGRNAEALAAYERYIQLAPNDPNAYDSLGLYHQWLGRYDEANAAYQRALMLNPESAVAIIHLGNLYFQKGRYREAIEQYQRYVHVVQDDASRARGYSCFAWVYLRKGDTKRAEAALKQTLRIDETGIWSYFTASLLGDLAAVERLKSQFFQELEAGGFLRIYYRVLGLAALKQGRPEEAIQNFKETLKHQPLSWSIDSFEDCLASAYLELGRLDEAIAEYERILKINPIYPLAHYNLAQAYERKGQQDQARAAYERFLQTWKDADADLPEVIVARQRLAK